MLDGARPLKELSSACVRPVSLTVRTLPFHGSNRGSIPLPGIWELSSVGQSACLLSKMSLVQVQQFPYGRVSGIGIAADCKSVASALHVQVVLRPFPRGLCEMIIQTEEGVDALLEDFARAKIRPYTDAERKETDRRVSELISSIKRRSISPQTDLPFKMKQE